MIRRALQWAEAWFLTWLVTSEWKRRYPEERDE